MQFEQNSTTPAMPDVLIFKSNIRLPHEAWALCQALESVPGVERCTLDLEDCDRVLRVAGDDLESSTLVKIVGDWGLNIEELD
ncbi:MAG: hypothetical protein IPN76_18730 [Saprospiraceae bacterium]|jgi:hypothetical protein|nr:hypothetical protein [Saprospiraceae bacterium]